MTAAVALMMGGASFMLSRPDASVPSTTVITMPRVTTQIKETRVSPEVVASTMPKWFRARESGWASDGSRTVTFELEAENEVAVWMKRVRPVLAVRCLGRETEVYVVTDSASSIEPTPDKHTVRIGFDKQADVEQRWLDSSGHRELFSPDAATLAGRDRPGRQDAVQLFAVQLGSGDRSVRRARLCHFARDRNQNLPQWGQKGRRPPGRSKRSKNEEVRVKK